MGNMDSFSMLVYYAMHKQNIRNKMRWTNFSFRKVFWYSLNLLLWFFLACFSSNRPLMSHGLFRFICAICASFSLYFEYYFCVYFLVCVSVLQMLYFLVFNFTTAAQYIDTVHGILYYDAITSFMFCVTLSIPYDLERIWLDCSTTCFLGKKSAE